MLTGAHQTQRMASALTFVEQYHEDGDKFLNHIIRVIGDETQISFVNVEIQSSKSSGCTHSPNEPKKFKQTPGRKLMVTVFWDRKGVLMVGLMHQETQ
jgi:hypothetical protein